MDAIVSIGGGNTTVIGIPVRPVSPGILEETINGRRAAVAIRSDGLVVTPSTPARRGEVVRMYVVGVGQTSPTAQTNRVGVPDQKVLAEVAVGLDDGGIQPISVLMAENLIGVYEVTFKIPDTAQLGERSLGLVVAPAPGQQFFGNGSSISIGQ